MRLWIIRCFRMDEKALTELLECSVCLDQLDETSKVLPCQHTFCKRCLDGIVNSKRELRCPECRFVVETRVEDLPSNILLIRLLESMKIQAIPQMLVHKHRSVPTSAAVTVPVQKQAHSPVNTSLPCAKALYNYEAKEPGDLSFKKGDVILLKRQVDENWYHGEFQGQHGFFPASYVQVTTPLPQEIPTCKSLYDFVINDQNEKDCLTFNKDEMITVIRRVDDNWAEGKLGEKIGIFPISFVEMNDAAKWLINSQISNTSPSSPGLQLLSSSGSSVPPHPGMPQNSGAYILHHPSLTGMQTTNKRHSLTTITMGNAGSQPNTARQMQPNRHSMDVQCLVNLTSPPGGVSRGNTSCIQHNMVFSNTGGMPHKSYLQHPQLPTSTANVPVATQQSNLPVTASTVIYVALYNYNPQKDDEIELRKGDCYVVTEKCQDGWFKGTCLRSSKQGVFPGNYVRLIKPSTKQPSLGAAGLKMGVNSASQSHRVHHIISNSRQGIPKTTTNIEGQSRSKGHPVIRRSKSNGSPEPPPSSRVKRSPSMNTASERTEDLTNRASNSEINRQNSRSNSQAELDDNGNVTQGATEENVRGKSAENSPSGSAQCSPVNASPQAKSAPASVSAPVTRDSSLESEQNPVPQSSSAEQDTSPSSKQSPSNNSSPQKETSSNKVPKLRTQKNSQESQSTSSVLMSSCSIVNESNLVVNLSVTAPSVTSAAASLTTSPMTSVMSVSAPASLQDAGRTHKSSKEVSASSVDNGSFPSGPSPPVPKRHPRSKSSQNRSRQPPVPPMIANLATKHSSAPTSNVKAPPNVVIGAVGGISSKSAEVLPASTKAKKEKKERDKLSAALRKLTKSSKKSSRSPSHEASTSQSDAASSSHQRSSSMPSEAGKGVLVAGHHKASSSGDGSAMVSRPSKPKPLIRERARCIVPYPPQSEIELELKVGDVVYVHRKREDGWFKGTLQRTGKTGLFPGSFVEIC